MNTPKANAMSDLLVQYGFATTGEMRALQAPESSSLQATPGSQKGILALAMSLEADLNAGSKAA